MLGFMKTKYFVRCQFLRLPLLFISGLNDVSGIGFITQNIRVFTILACLLKIFFLHSCLNASGFIFRGSFFQGSCDIIV
jgi:hypothetical protein